MQGEVYEESSMNYVLTAAAIVVCAQMASAQKAVIPADSLASLGGVTMAQRGVVQNQPPAPYSRPGQSGYSVAKAFVAIVRRDQEVNVQDLSYAFGLPALLNRGFIWHGPFGEYDHFRFSAYYDPPTSPLGITKIVIEWDGNTLGNVATVKSGFTRRLTLHLRPEACPSEAEMAAVTGVPMTKVMVPAPDAGPSYPARWFNMPDGKGGTKSIYYSPIRCEISASYTR